MTRIKQWNNCQSHRWTHLSSPAPRNPKKIKQAQSKTMGDWSGEI